MDKTLIIVCALLVGFVLLNVFDSVFPCWVLVVTILNLISVSILWWAAFARPWAMYTRKERIKFQIRRGVIFLLGCFLFWAFFYIHEVYNLYWDLPDYFRGDYAYVEGYGEIETGHRSSVQYVTISDMELTNRRPVDLPTFQGKRMRVYYLSHSKYVMDIRLLE